MMMDDAGEYWRRVFAFSPFTVWFNLTGQPGLMLPLGQSAGSLPLAVQLVGRYGDESTLLRLGSQLEAARPWFGRKPALASWASRCLEPKAALNAEDAEDAEENGGRMDLLHRDMSR